MNKTWETVVAFKLVWVRVIGYMLLPMAVTFLAQTETWSGQTWTDTPAFIKWRLVIICFIPGFSALLGFIDQSLGRAKENLNEKLKTGDTTPPFKPEKKSNDVG